MKFKNIMLLLVILSLCSAPFTHAMNNNDIPEDAGNEAQDDTQDNDPNEAQALEAEDNNQQIIILPTLTEKAHFCFALTGDVDALKNLMANFQASGLTLNVNSIASTSGRSMLYLASSAGNFDMVKFLIEQGAQDDQDENLNRTALHIACENNHIHIVEMLIYKKFSDINARDRDGRTPLHLACANKEATFIYRHGKYMTTVGLLLENDSNIKALASAERVLALHVACVNGCIAFIRELLDCAEAQGITHEIINATTQTGCTPLLFATAFNNADITKLLVERGADVNLCPVPDKETPFYSSCTHDNLEITQYLLDHGAQIDDRNISGMTALHAACLKEATGTVTFFVQQGLDVNDNQNIDQNTPLHVASTTLNVEIIKILLNNGASVNARNINGTTALWIACGNGFIEIAYLLITNGADMTLEAGPIAKVMPNPMSPSEIAQASSHFALANFLIALQNDDQSIYVSPEDLCALCQDQCASETLGITLSCRHIFHEECSRGLADDLCPLCRAHTNIDVQDVNECKKVIVFRSHIPTDNNKKKRDHDENKDTQEPNAKRRRTETA